MLYLLDLWTDVCLLTCLPSKLYEVRICQCCVYSCWKQTGGVYSLQTTWTSGGTSWLIWCPTRRAALLRGAGCRAWIVWPPCFHNLWSSLTCAPHFRPDRRLGRRRLHIGAHCHQIHMTPRWQKKIDTSGFDVMPTLKKLNPLKPAAPPPHPTQQHGRAEDKTSAGPERKTGGGFYFVLFKSFVFLWF